MRNKLFYLTKVSLNRKIKSKWFVIVNILLLVAICALVNIDNVINLFGGKFNEVQEILVINNSNIDNSFEMLNETSKASSKLFGDVKKFKLINYIKGEKDAKKEIKKKDKILIVLNSDENNYLSAKMISNKSIDDVLNQMLVTSLDNTKKTVALSLSNIDSNELAKVNAPIVIEKEYLDKSEKSGADNMEMIATSIFPILILPFYMLALFLVQMIGAEVNDEKTTRGMEIIISNVSPKVHFTSKILAGNLFVLIQGAILLVSGGIGLLIRKLIGSKSLFSTDMIDMSSIWTTLNESGILSQLKFIIPIAIILLLLSFVAYSLVAGILASMTTNIEDYQQIQTPIVIISLLGYYLSILAGLFEGSIFIRIMSYIPFISCLLSPSLLLMGQINIIDISISLILLIGTIYLLIKYGMRIYKVGILNYSSSNLWRKMFKAVKETK